MISFDPDSHTYTDESGRIIPNVTTILKPIQNLEHIPKALLEKAAKFGRHVHLACEYYDKGILDEETLDPELVLYLNGWKKFLADTGFQVTGNECQVYSEKWGYAGTLDRTGILGKSGANPDMVDIKTPRNPYPTNGPQLAAYAQAFQEQFGIRIRKRFAITLSENAYKLTEYKDKGDFNIFLSCLAIHNWRTNYYG